MKLVETKVELITLVKGNKKIQRPLIDYKNNKAMWEFRDKPEENNVKEEKVVQLK